MGLLDKTSRKRKNNKEKIKRKNKMDINIVNRAFDLVWGFEG